MSNNIECVIITGPSGVGKTTLVNALLSMYKKRLMRIITHTTRKPRYNEIEGVDYNFINMTSFEEKKARGEFIEAEKVYSNWYGVSKSEIKQCSDEERLPILTLSCRGAEKFYGKKGYLVIFIAPESHEVLKKKTVQKKNRKYVSVKNKIRTMSCRIRDAE